MLALRSPPLRTTLRSLFWTAPPKLNQPLKSPFTSTSLWLRPDSGKDGTNPLPSSTQSLHFSGFWTPEESDMLESLHKQGMKPREMLSHLPFRNLASIKTKWSLVYGKPRHVWLPEDFDRLIALLKSGADGVTIQAQFPGRTYSAIRSAIHKVRSGKTASKVIPWTKVDHHLLMSLRGYHTAREIQAAHFPNRTEYAINKELERMMVRYPAESGIRLTTRRPWTQEDVDKLLDLHSKDLEKREICQILNRSPAELSRKGAALGLAMKRSQRQTPIPWTEEAEAILLPLIKRPLHRHTAERLFPDRSYSSIAKRVTDLRKREGLTRPQEPWTHDEDIKLRNLVSQGYTASKISAELGRHIEVVIYRMSHLSRP
jgi:hypothetical protein